MSMDLKHATVVVRLCPLLLLLFVFSMLRPPCASLPHGLEYFVVRVLVTSLSIQSLLNVVILTSLIILLKLGELLCSNVYFVPFNVSLNMLNRKRRNELSSLIPVIVYSIYFLLCYSTYLYYTGALIHILMLNYAHLDNLCIYFWRCSIYVTILIFDFGFFVVKKVMIFLFNEILFPKYHCYEVKTIWIFSLLILLSYDIHPNPGPRSSNEFSSGFLSFCNWNLNTLSKDNFCRVSLLEAHNTIHNYDIISLCETSLNDEIQIPENLLPGYIYHPLNHPDGRKSGGVGIFYKESLPLRIRADLSFDECLVCELKFPRKKIFFTVFYRNPEHKVNSTGFETFLENFEQLYSKIYQEKPYASFFTGDVNGHTQAWYPDGDTNPEGSALDELFSSLNLSQIINEPTHFFRDDCAPSCIDIILTDQPNVILHSGVRPSLDPLEASHYIL